MSDRQRLDFAAIIVVLITFVSGAGAIGYSFLHDNRNEPCSIAAAWIGDETPNPSVSAADRARLSASMVRKVLECTK